MSPLLSLGNSKLSATLTRSMHEHWGLFLAEGIALIVLGLPRLSFR